MFSSLLVSSFLPEKLQGRIKDYFSKAGVEIRTEKAKVVAIPPEKNYCYSVIDKYGPEVFPLLIDCNPLQIPYLRGYDHHCIAPDKKSGIYSFLSRSFLLKPNAPYQMNDIIEPGDWPLPIPNKKVKWRPTCYVSMSNILQLPVWLLRNPQLVYLIGRDILPYLSILEMTGKDVRNNREVFRGAGKKTFLTGPEMISRIPLENSFLMSVAGWPMRYVPIKYLFFLANKGTPKRRSHPKLAIQIPSIKWRDASYSGIDDTCIPFAHEFPEVDLLRSPLLKYLNSYEGRERLAAAGLLIRKIKNNLGQLVSEMPGVDDPVHPYQDNQYSNRGIKGIWNGTTFSKVEEFLFEDDLINTIFNPEIDPIVFCQQAGLPKQKERIKELIEKRSPKIEMFQKRRARHMGRQEAAYETFSIRDKERFGKWNGDIARFLPTQKSYSTLQKIRNAIQEGDIDPTPVDMILTGGSEWGGRRLTSEPQWTSPWSEEKPFDWHPPSLPINLDQAYERAYQFLNDLEILNEKWKKRNAIGELYRTHHWKDSREDFFDREEDRDLVWIRLDWFCFQVISLLPENDPILLEIEERFLDCIWHIEGRNREEELERIENELEQDRIERASKAMEDLKENLIYNLRLYIDPALRTSIALEKAKTDG